LFALAEKQTSIAHAVALVSDRRWPKVVGEIAMFQQQRAG
jgi:hypothetical protein